MVRLSPHTTLLSLLALLTALWGAPGSTQAQSLGEDAYERGMELLRQDDWTGALDVWYDGYSGLSAEGVHDPRIGIAYIRAVADHRQVGEYETASEIFAWGFSGSDLASYRETVAEEVARIQPLMEAADSARFQDLLDADDPEILREIRVFWMEKDPTPDTSKNERLIEHWERVVYARENYVRGRYSPYESDDRGTIYVKFGEPDKKKGGSLGAREDELRIWVRDPLARENIRRYDTNPQFEIWVYDQLNPREFVYFLFGNQDGTGPFRLVPGPRELIPDEAFSPSTRLHVPGSVKAAYYLELFYYADLSSIGGPYADRFSELEQLWGTAESRGFTRGTSGVPTEGDLESYHYKYEQEDRYHRTDRPTSPDFSDFDDGSRAVEMVVEPVRVLSPENTPQVYVVALSAPKRRIEASSSGRIRRRDIVLSAPDYVAHHTLVIRDVEFQEIGRVSETVTPEKGDMSVFVLNHPDERLHYTLLVEIERDADEARLETSQLPGRAQFEVGPPLSTDLGALEMSDVVTGVAPTADEQYDHMPFPVIPSRTIWWEDPIRLYVELYHLVRDLNGVARYRFDFTIESTSDEGRPPPGSQPVTLSMDLEFLDMTSRDVFDIDISAMPLGAATVTVRATDLQSGHTVERTVPVEIVR
jgi:GWxTD domain-containing protein